MERIELKPEDLKVESYDPDYGRGRWSLNKNRGVTVTHLPTGLKASSGMNDNVNVNRANAFRMLEDSVNRKVFNDFCDLIGNKTDRGELLTPEEIVQLAISVDAFGVSAADRIKSGAYKKAARSPVDIAFNEGIEVAKKYLSQIRFVDATIHGHINQLDSLKRK